MPRKTEDKHVVLVDVVVASELTQVSYVPHGVDGGVTFVEDDEEWRGGDALCQRLTVQILPGRKQLVQMFSLILLPH